MGEKEGLLARASRLFDLPADVLAGEPRLTLVGCGEFRMEGHRGILAYGPEEIHIAGGKRMIILRGEGLELRAMEPDQLLITGRIHGLELV